MEEIWKPILINDFDVSELYKVSNLGQIKSRAKSWYTHNHIRSKSETILKQGISPDGYHSVVLCKNKKRKTCKVHLLVWDHFGKRIRNSSYHKVDHIDNSKSNNSITNLQLLSHRENCVKRSIQSTKALPVGVSIAPSGNKFRARIAKNGKEIHLGIFSTSQQASKAYKKALREFK